MENYKTGDEVFYRRRNDQIWQGPAKVIGFDGKSIIIKHGRFTYSTSQPHLIKSRSGFNEQTITVPQNDQTEANDINRDMSEDESSSEEEDQVGSHIGNDEEDTKEDNQMKK